MDEVERIRVEYQRRSRDLPPDHYSLTKPVNLFFAQQRTRHALAALRRGQLLPLLGKRALEIGCGSGGWLPLLESFGVARGNLAGIDLDAARVARARQSLSAHWSERGELLSPGADIRLGDATRLPWPDGSFDLVVQSTVFTSVLDDTMRRALASEMIRVIAPQGGILWYDFLFNNPCNPNVRGIGRGEIESLFPGCRVDLRRITLAPPIARRVVPWSWLTALAIEGTTVLNTHFMGLIRKIRSA
jgi:SAM-dependent methyltransferase